MSTIKNYYRPRSVAEALDRLAEPNAAVLAGGTHLVPAAIDAETVVDLQAVGLDEISKAGQSLTLGAMVRLQTLVDSEDVPSLVRQLAQREGPNTLRNMGTVGGTVVAGDDESELLAALLVYEALVTVQTGTGRETMPLADFRLPPRGLVTAVTIRRDGKAAAERVARTPADRPIVAVAGRRAPDGALRLAFCGVAGRPVLAGVDDIDHFDPPADFRGSSGYRMEMARVLAGRVLAALGVTG